MTKKDFKKEKDKLLVLRNTVRSRIRANDQKIITELSQLTGLQTPKELIKSVEKQHDESLKELKQKFAEAEEKKNAIREVSNTKVLPANFQSTTEVPDDKGDPLNLDYNKKSIEVKPHRLRSDNAKDVAPQYLAPDRKRVASLKIWQRKASDNVLDCIERGDEAHMIRSGTGTGKTFMIGDIIQQLHDSGWFKKKWPTFYPCLIVTPPTVVPQFIDNMKYMFGLEWKKEFFVTNYEQLRTTYGERYIIKKKIADEDGNVTYDYEWIPGLNPPLIIWDECHKLKNDTSTQHRVALALNKLPTGYRTTQIGMSATPWSRIADCKHFTISAGLKI